MATATHRVTDAESHAHPPAEAMVVRFAGDRSERKLMADYAPLKRR